MSNLMRPALLRSASAFLVIAVAWAARDVGAADAVPLVGNRPAEITTMTPVGKPAANHTLNMELTLKLRNQAALDQLLAEQQDPTSPNYHKWLTPEEFTARFGPNQADIDAVAKWLTSEGFQVTETSRAERYVRFNGTVSQAEHTFGTTIASFFDSEHYANTVEPLIPSQFAGVIGDIRGLSNIAHAQHMGTIRAPAARSTRLRREPSFPLWSTPFLSVGAGAWTGSGITAPEFKTSGGAEHFGPSDFYSFYDEQALSSGGITANGTGTHCIALIEDSNFLQSAVDLFNNTFSLPHTPINTVLIGGDPGRKAPDEGEALADIELSHAVAPAAPLTAYIANTATTGVDLTSAIQRAVSDNACGSIDISFGFCGETTAFYRSLDTTFQQAGSQGQSVFVSSGDDGAAALIVDPVTMKNCITGTSRGVSEMAASPNATGVGGTQFTPTYDSSGNLTTPFPPEAVWNENKSNCPTIDAPGASGGGASGVFLKSEAPYQSGPCPSGACTPADGKRDVPDVALAAGVCNPGFFFGDDPNQSGSPALSVAGGTSLSSALWAGIAALIEQVQGGKVGLLNPRLYQLGAARGTSQSPNCDPTTGLCDIVTGNNNFNGVTGFSAGPGYDQATGLGTVDINKFVNAYVGITVSAPPAPTVTAAPSTSVSPGSFTLTSTSTAITINSVTISLSNPAVFGGMFSVTPSGSTAVSQKPSANMTFTFSGVSVPSTGSKSLNFSLSAATAAAIASAPSPVRYAGLLGGTEKFSLLMLIGVVGLFVRTFRRKFMLCVALVVLLAAGFAGCGGGGGASVNNGIPISSAVTLTGVSTSAGSFASKTPLATVILQ